MDKPGNRSCLEPDFLQALAEQANSGRAFALALVLEAEGSTPAGPGAKAIMRGTGVICGTIGGGPIEARTHQRAPNVIESGQPAILEFSLEGADAAEAIPLCGGRVRVLLDPTAAAHRAVFDQAAAAGRRRQRGLLLTIVRPISPLEVTRHWVPESEVSAWTSFPGAAVLESVLAHEAPEFFAVEAVEPGDRVEVLAEPVAPQPILVIMGGGHVGQALAWQASLVGFEIVVLDDRAEFTDPARWPAPVTTHCGPLADLAAAFPAGPDTYVVIVTRGHQHDAAALAACVRRPFAYVGMIGSRRKVRLMRQDFLTRGLATEAEFDRVYAPVGLDLGAVTVPEIAASIIAQLVAVRRKGRAVRIPLV